MTQKHRCLPHTKLIYGRDNGTIVGRQEDLKWIHGSFMEHHIVAIYGLGGIGKT
jgi:hydrogenase maturation factor HypF (carbamoyltransferase family)